MNENGWKSGEKVKFIIRDVDFSTSSKWLILDIIPIIQNIHFFKCVWIIFKVGSCAGLLKYQ